MGCALPPSQKARNMTPHASIRTSNAWGRWDKQTGNKLARLNSPPPSLPSPGARPDAGRRFGPSSSSSFLLTPPKGGASSLTICHLYSAYCLPGQHRTFPPLILSPGHSECLPRSWLSLSLSLSLCLPSPAHTHARRVPFLDEWRALGGKGDLALFA